MRTSVIVVCALSGLGCASGARPATTTALATNATRVTRCAEEDNVYVKLSGQGLTGMRIEARQPPYISQLKVDDSKANFSDCHFERSENPVYTFEPKLVVLWENERFVMLGNTYETFWRPSDVDVVVEGRVTKHVHLIQLHVKDATEPTHGRHEFLVLYPPDGYWRAKPIPSAHMPSSTYGTSFLVGPVLDGKRPLVELARVEFEPARLSFVLVYKDGSRGTMKLLDVNRDKVVLDYTQDRPQPDRQPMAAIRSMFITPERSDVADVKWRMAPDAEPATRLLTDFTQAPVSEVSFGRTVISDHNPSAPDMWFGDFKRR